MNYQEIGNFELNEDIAQKWAFHSLILLIISTLFFFLIALLWSGGLSFVFRWYTIPANIIITALLFLLHELIHGLTINVFGARASYTYGTKAGVPYLATTTESLLTRNQYLAVALSPFILITAAGILTIHQYPQTSLLLSIPLGIHTSGAIGDLSIVKILLGYSDESLIKDELTGFTVYRKDPKD